jgi:hypothetical protein
MTFCMNDVKSGADAIRQAKRSVSAASQSRSASESAAHASLNEQAMTSRGCEGQSPCARRGLDGDGLGDPDRDPIKEVEPQNAKRSDCCRRSRTAARRLHANWTVA